MNNPRIPKIKEIDTFDNNNQAKEILTNLYYELKEIIDQKGYVISNIKEFYPDDECLLGENQSNDTDAVIYVRLRTPENSNIFYSFEEALETFLHEICHCEIGPHNNEFHKLLDHLTEWYEQTTMNNKNEKNEKNTLRKIAFSNKEKRISCK